MAKKKERKSKGTLVTVEDIIEMKILKMKGYPTTRIASETKRDSKTVTRGLELLEKMLPEENDLKERVLDKLEEMQEQLMQNARRICFASDVQVMQKINTDETSAIEAAKIRQIYGNDLMRMLGLAGGGEVDDSGNSAKVQNFITTIINIQQNQKDDRLKATTGVKETDGRNDERRKEDCVEGVVSE